MIAGMMVILPFDGAAEPPEGYIKGHVSDGTNPLPDSFLFYMPTFGGAEGGGWTDAEGNYSLTVPGGIDYSVMAFNDSCYAGNMYASVDPGETVYLNFSLVTIAPAVTDVTIMGFLKDELGDPVSAGNVAGFTSDPATMGDGPPIYVNMTSVDGSGMYVVNVLPSVSGGGVASLDVPGYPFVDNSTEEEFVSGGTYWINLTLEPVSYNNDATLSGTVTDQDTGLPLENVMVTCETWNETTEDGSTNYTWTDADGDYFMNVTSGSARVVMSKAGYTMFMQDRIEILPGEDEVVDATLRVVNAFVRGNVTDGSSGLPINMARVFVFDFMNGTMNMAFTDITGAYELEAFDGMGLVIGSEADGYGGQYMYVDISPGEELWMDFELRAVDAWAVGQITDTISGLPIPNAQLEFSSPDYSDWTDVNESGHYNLTLVSGDYTVRVYAMDYRYVETTATIIPGMNTLDFELLPQDLPETVLLHGYVNDSVSGVGIDQAGIEISLPPPDYSNRNGTETDSSGYYEIYVPPVEIMAIISAYDHVHEEVLVNAVGETEVRLDITLDPDVWSPNVTYSQAPRENITWSNPTWIHASAQERDPQSISLWQYYKNGSGSGWSYYYAVEILQHSFNPFDWNPDNLPFSQVGDVYEVDYGWTAEPKAGLLSNGVSSLYLQYYEIWMGPDMYNAWRGEYVNSSMSSPEQGTALFAPSGEFMLFSFDNGSMPIATVADPTGLITSYVVSIQVLDGTESWFWRGNEPMGDWSVVDTTLTPDWTAPSGEYATLFYISDWGGRGASNLTLFTVDNDPPVADAGPGQQAVVNTTVTLNGSMSYDNVGISSYRWNFSDGGPVELWGEVVDYVFTTGGMHDITLTVWDGAGHADIATTWVEVLGDTPPIADAGSDQDVAFNTVVYFDGTGSSDDVGIVNYTWTIIELMEYMWGSTPDFTFSDPGTYNVSLVVEDTIGQFSAPDTMMVTARDVTSPTADAGADQLEMGGVEVVLDGAGSWDDVGIVNWTWTFEHMGVPVTLWGEVVGFTFWEEGVYDITLNVSDAAGNWDTDVVQVTISGMIPEFPSMLLPVTGMLAVVLFVVFRRRRL